MAKPPEITANSAEQFSDLQKKYDSLPDYTRETVTQVKYDFTTHFIHTVKRQHRSSTIIPIKCMPSNIRIKKDKVLISDWNHHEHHYYFDCGEIPENLEIETRI